MRNYLDNRGRLTSPKHRGIPVSSIKLDCHWTGGFVGASTFHRECVLGRKGGVDTGSVRQENFFMSIIYFFLHLI